MNRVLVIIAAEHVPSARALLEMEPFYLSAQEAANTFVRAGSPTGELPATHWWLSAKMSETSLAACIALCNQLPWASYHEYDMDTDPGYPMAALTELGLQTIIPDI